MAVVATMTERQPSRSAAISGVLRNPLSVIAAAAASFLVTLVVLTARVVSGVDPALRTSGSSAVISSHHAHAVLRTTTSGRVVAGVSQGSGAENAGAQPARVVTRTSGGFAGGGERDG
jgi:hypothetical protein